MRFEIQDQGEGAEVTPIRLHKYAHSKAIALQVMVDGRLWMTLAEVNIHGVVWATRQVNLPPGFTVGDWDK